MQTKLYIVENIFFLYHHIVIIIEVFKVSDINSRVIWYNSSPLSVLVTDGAREKLKKTMYIKIFRNKYKASADFYYGVPKQKAHKKIEIKMQSMEWNTMDGNWWRWKCATLNISFPFLIPLLLLLLLWVIIAVYIGNDTHDDSNCRV